MDVFKQVRSSIDAVLNGDDATILAYGQTGSGKTFTMFGDADQASYNDYEADLTNGIIPRSIQYLFDRIQSMQQADEEAAKAGKG